MTRRVVFALVAVAIVFAVFAAPVFAQDAGGTSPAVSDQMLYLMAAGFVVTGLTGLAKKLVPNLDGAAAQRTVAFGMTLLVFGATKLLHLAPDLQSSAWGVIVWLVGSYGLSAGIYAHTKDLKPEDPAQLSGPR